MVMLLAANELSSAAYGDFSEVARDVRLRRWNHDGIAMEPKPRGGDALRPSRRSAPAQKELRQKRTAGERISFEQATAIRNARDSEHRMGGQPFE